MNSPVPPPFGDPSRVQSENAAAIKKGIGCSCGGCAALAASFVFLFVLIFSVVMYFIRNSDGVEAAVKLAKENAALVEMLGEPIEIGWLVNGSIQGAGVGAKVEVNIPLTGPKGAGTLMAQGYRETEQKWRFTMLRFAPENADEAMDLLK